MIALMCAVAAAVTPAEAQERSRQETRSGVLEFESNGYPTDETVRRLEEEIDYQRAVQAYIHFIPAVGMMPWRNAHFDVLGGKAGDLNTHQLKAGGSLSNSCRHCSLSLGVGVVFRAASRASTASVIVSCS
jgi:hypothetical protein